MSATTRTRSLQGAPSRAAEDVSTPRSAALAGWAAALLTIAAFALRYGLAMRSGLSRDEVQLLDIAGLPSIRAVIDFLRSHESHPPLFYLLVRGWTTLLGTSEVVLNAMPALLGALLVPAMYAAGRRLGGPPAGLWAAALAAFSPTLIGFSAIFRPYCLLTTLALGSVILLMSAMEGGSKATWIGYVGATCALLWMHTWGIIVLAAEWGVVGFVAFGRGRRGLLRQWIMAEAAVLLATSPWIAVMLHQAQAAGYPPSDLGIAMRSVTAPMTLLGIGFSLGLSAPPGSGIPFVLVAAFWLLWMVAHLAVAGVPARAPAAPGARVRLLFLLGVPGLAAMIAVVLSAHSDVLQARCFLIVAPPMLLAVAWGLAELGRRGVQLFPIGMAILLAGIYALQLGTSIRRKSNAREIAVLVSASARPTDLVVEAPANLTPAFDRYLDSSIARLPLPDDGVHPVPYDHFWDRYDDRRTMVRARAALHTARVQGRRVWLVTSDDFLAPPPPPGTEGLGTEGIEHRRTAELRLLVRRLYGPPRETIRYFPERYEERLTAVLFEPRAPQTLTSAPLTGAQPADGP